LAAGNIISVVAVFIALELGSATTFFHVLDTSIALNLVRAVQAFAFFAVSVIFGATTVTAIPITASIVVVIVAVTIAFPLWCATTFLDRFDASVALRYEGTVPTLAFFAKVVVVLRSAAITLVPVATRVVVVIVTVFVPDVIFSTTTTFNVIGAFVSLGYECAVLAFAFFTEVIIVFPAAVATIPIATGVVVVIITVLVTLPLDISALVLDFLNTFVAFVFELAVQTFATLLFVTIIVVVFYPTAIA